MPRLTAAALIAIVTILPFLQAAEPIIPPAGMDQYGDPLPVGAIARLGTVRLRVNHATGVSFSPDGQKLAACGWNPVVSVWEVQTGAPLEPYRTDPAGELMAVRFSPNGEYLAAVGEAGEVWVWDTDSHQQLWYKKQHKGRTYGIAFAPDGSSLATAGGFNDPSVELWNLSDGKHLSTWDIGERVGDDCPVEFSPDGKLLVVAAHQDVQVFDIAKQQVVTEIKRPFRQEVSSVWFVDGGDSLLVGGYGIQRVDSNSKTISQAKAGIKRFDADTGKLQTEIPAPEERMSDPKLKIMPDGESFVYVGRNALYVCSLDDGSVQQQWPREENTWYVRAGGVSLQPQGPYLAELRNQQIRLVNLDMGSESHRDLRGHDGYVTSVASHPNGKTAVTGGDHGEVYEWELDTGRFIRELPSLEGWVRCLEFTLDGKTLLIAGEARSEEGEFIGEVKVCDYESGSKLWGREVPGRVMAAAVSADGKEFVLAGGLGADGPFGSDPGLTQVKVGSLTSGEVSHTFGDLKHRPVSIALDTSGNSVRMVDERGGLHGLNFDDTKSRDTTSLLKITNKKAGRPLAQRATGTFTVLTGIEYPEGNRRPDQRKGWLALVENRAHNAKWIESIGFDYSQHAAISPDGRLVANSQIGPKSAGREGSVFIRSAKDGQMLWVFPLDDFEIFSLAFNSDSTRLLGGTARGDVVVWDLSMIDNGEIP